MLSRASSERENDTLSALYISDLDGTLLMNDARLSNVTRSILQELLADGLPFSVASARAVSSMRPMLAGLDLRLPVIELNGAFLSELTTGRHAVVNAIEPALAEEVYAALLAAGCAPLVSTFDGCNDCVYHGTAINTGMQWYLDDRVAQRDPRLRPNGDTKAALREQVVCITAIGEEARLAELHVALGERHSGAVELHFFENGYSPGWHWLTVHDARATKAQGVRTLAELCGLSTEELIVFGDHVNDIKIFEIAAHAVAVANAHPDLKQVATHEIGSNEEHSVARYIREHWLARGGARPPESWR